MSIEEYIPSEGVSESDSGGNEKSKEISEKFKQQVKKASSGIKKTQKDEKKAKKQDMLLANFLVKLIIQKKFDTILELLFKLIDKGYPSNFLLGILSLIYIEISHKIREVKNKEKINFNFKSKENIIFNAKHIDLQVQLRINNWVEDIIMSTSSEYSSILTKRLIRLLENGDNDVIEFTSTIFAFFLKNINIGISKNEALNISSFILTEVLKKIKILKLEEI